MKKQRLKRIRERIRGNGRGERWSRPCQASKRRGRGRRATRRRPWECRWSKPQGTWTILCSDSDPSFEPPSHTFSDFFFFFFRIYFFLDETKLIRDYEMKIKINDDDGSDNEEEEKLIITKENQPDLWFSRSCPAGEIEIRRFWVGVFFLFSFLLGNYKIIKSERMNMIDEY